MKYNLNKLPVDTQTVMRKLELSWIQLHNDIRDGYFPEHRLKIGKQKFWYAEDITLDVMTLPVTVKVLCYITGCSRFEVEYRNEIGMMPKAIQKKGYPLHWQAKHVDELIEKINTPIVRKALTEEQEEELLTLSQIWDQHKIADHFGICQPTVSRILTRKGIRSNAPHSRGENATERQKLKIIKLARNTDMNQVEIAAAVGCNQGTVSRVIREQGIQYAGRHKRGA